MESTGICENLNSLLSRLLKALFPERDMPAMIKLFIFMTPACDIAGQKADSLNFLRTIKYSDKMYYCFFIKKKSAHYSKLKAILESHGAMSYERYKRNVGEEVRRIVEKSSN